MTPEGAIQNQICSWLHFNKIFFWVNKSVGIYDPTRKCFRANKSPYFIKGTSDILGIWYGKFLAIEVKTKTGRLSPEQKIFIQRVNQEGGIAFVARSVDDVIKHLMPIPKSLMEDVR